MMISNTTPGLSEVSKEDAILALFTRGQYVTRDKWDDDYFIYLDDGAVMTTKYNIEVEPKYFAHFLLGQQFFIRN